MHFTKLIALQDAGRGVRANVVVPGWIATGTELVADGSLTGKCV